MIAEGDRQARILGWGGLSVPVSQSKTDLGSVAIHFRLNHDSREPDEAKEVLRLLIVASGHPAKTLF